MSEPVEPVGFKRIETAPRDGTSVRLRFRTGLLRETGREEVGCYQEMPDGFKGWWRKDGTYITPGPLFWAPETGAFQ